MSCNISSRCLPPCEVTCPPPCVCSRNQEPCVVSCGDSKALLYAPPVSVTFPGAVLSSCPQETIVGTALPISVGAITPYGSDGSNGRGGSMSGSGGSYGYGGSYGSGGSSGIGGSFGSGGMSGS
ncbi:KRFJ protein, partial [Centropus unirufus]|nr:KRFJ protein [Centropus unirufus]